MKADCKKIYYFIGIGGVGMSALARLCLKDGYSVYGYDKISSEITDQLVKKGIKIIFDNSNYSKYLLENIKNNNFIAVEPKNIEDLILEISKINFGIFIDSGPLHIAKCYNKNGIFIETSVSSKILLSNSKNIIPVSNKYKSNYCKGPCGLVDVFAYEDKVGCYETHKLSFKDVSSLKSQKKLQRWNKKENNSHFISNPVGCIKQIDVKNIIELIRYKIKES